MFYKEKGFYISLISGIAAIAAFVIICLNMVGNNPETQTNPEAENNLLAEASEEPKETVRPTETPDSEAVAKVIPAKSESPKPSQTPKATQSGKTKNATENIHFNQEAGLLWPLNGDVLMEYSPEQAIYFETLGQYRTNPAMIIGGKVGAKVKASADGVVESIAKVDETGKTLTLSIGDGYKLVYGQLKDVTVKKGDTVKEGAIIGKLAKPTSYYSAEGANLYYQVKSGKETVNPMVFLR